MFDGTVFEDIKTFENEVTPEFFQNFHNSIRIVRQNTVLASTSTESTEMFKSIHEQLAYMNTYFRDSIVLLYPSDIIKTQSDYDEIEAFVNKSERLQCVNVVLRFPNRHYINVRANPSLPVRDAFRLSLETDDALKPLSDDGLLSHPLILHPKRVLLLNKGVAFRLDDPGQLYSVCGPITPGSELQVVMTFTEAPIKDENLTYDPFIMLTMPSEYEEDVSINVKPVVHFQTNTKAGLSIHYDSVVDDSLVMTQSANTNGMIIALGKERAEARGYIKWVNTEYNHKIFLLEVSDPKVDPKDYVRYSFDNNKNYAGTDRHSWQRYTKKFPIDCYRHLDEGEEAARLVPVNPLKPNTHYCLLLQNKVSTEPSGGCDSSIFNYGAGFILEDKLIYFKTRS